MSNLNLDDLIQCLDSHPLAEPPAELHPRIMAAIARSRPRTSRGVAGLVPRWMSEPRLRFATIFGLGLVTGVALLSAVRSGKPDAWNAVRRVDPAHVSGSMIEPGAGREPLETIPISVADGGVIGSADVYRVGEETRFDVSLESSEESPGPVEWSLSFDPAAWEVAGVDRPAGSDGTLAVGPADVHGSTTGPGRVTVAMRRLDAPGAQAVVFQVVKSGRVVFAHTALPASP
jgi:hypothetical protein